jgi:hypothetical protein
MSAQLALPIGRRARLAQAITIAFGRIAVVAADGDDGQARLELKNPPPGIDPCPGCEHRARCVLLVGLAADGRPDPTGCPTATDWRAAEVAYAERLQ